MPQSNTLAGADLTAFRARKHEIDTMIAQAEASPTGAVANNDSGYRFDMNTDTAQPQALAQTEPSSLRNNGGRPLRSAITTTRGTR